MKKSLVISLVMLSVCTQAAAGPDRNQKWDAGFNLSMADAQSTNMDESLYLSGSVSYGINEMLAVGASLGYTSVGFQAMTPSGLVSEGPDLTITPVFGDIILRVPTGDQPFTPYAIFGLGALLSASILIVRRVPEGVAHPDQEEQLGTPLEPAVVPPGEVP